ncbi:MAG: TetR/AcrR family transcriptional regulator [Micropruina sp.]|nr:TetR/AcrR family transcriptional regulator [Micropruina sp.]
MDELSPRALAKRRQITDAARSLFLAQGFSRTTMDAVTAEAGVSKQTLYAYFPSKTELLLEILTDARHALPAPEWLRPPETRAELRAALIGFGERLMDILFDAEMIAVLRLLLGEAVHLPAMRQSFLDALPLQLLGRARVILDGAAANGLIEFDQPDASVRMLVGPLMSYVIFGGLMATGEPKPPPDDVIPWLVDSYLRTLDFVDQGSPVPLGAESPTPAAPRSDER